MYKTVCLGRYVKTKSQNGHGKETALMSLEAPDCIWVSVSGEIAPVHKTAYLETQTQHMRRWIA